MEITMSSESSQTKLLLCPQDGDDTATTELFARCKRARMLLSDPPFQAILTAALW
jgi:hypothetical protein